MKPPHNVNTKMEKRLALIWEETKACGKIKKSGHNSNEK